MLTESALLQDYAVGSPVNENAILYMHSRIASHAECAPSSWTLHMLNSRNSELGAPVVFTFYTFYSGLV